VVANISWIVLRQINSWTSTPVYVDHLAGFLANHHGCHESIQDYFERILADTDIGSIPAFWVAEPI
jgi:hypothetical protein